MCEERVVFLRERERERGREIIISVFFTTNFLSSFDFQFRSTSQVERQKCASSFRVFERRKRVFAVFVHDTSTQVGIKVEHQCDKSLSNQE